MAMSSTTHGVGRTTTRRKRSIGSRSSSARGDARPRPGRRRLGDIARKEGYIPRSSNAGTRSGTRRRRASCGGRRSARRARSRIPEQGPARVVHGDYRLGQLHQRVRRPDRRGARLGDRDARRSPRGRRIRAPRGPSRTKGTGAPDVADDGAGVPPTRAELLERYAKRSGRDVSKSISMSRSPTGRARASSKASSPVPGRRARHDRRQRRRVQDDRGDVGPVRRGPVDRGLHNPVDNRDGISDDEEIGTSSQGPGRPSSSVTASAETTLCGTSRYLVRGSFRAVTWDQRGFGRARTGGRIGSGGRVDDLGGSSIIGVEPLTCRAVHGRMGRARVRALSPSRVRSLAIADSTAGVVTDASAKSSRDRTRAELHRGGGLPPGDRPRTRGRQAFLYQQIGGFRANVEDADMVGRLFRTRYPIEDVRSSPSCRSRRRGRGRPHPAGGGP